MTLMCRIAVLLSDACRLPIIICVIVRVCVDVLANRKLYFLLVIGTCFLDQLGPD